MPPRSKILPQTMQDGYRNSQVGRGVFLSEPCYYICICNFII